MEVLCNKFSWCKAGSLSRYNSIISRILSEEKLIFNKVSPRIFVTIVEVFLSGNRKENDENYDLKMRYLEIIYINTIFSTRFLGFPQDTRHNF